MAIAVDNSTHVFPAVAFDGTNYFVVWQQHPNAGMAASTADLYGVRVSPAGVVLDPAPIAVSTAVNGQSGPSIAFDGTNYLVIWLDARNQPVGIQPCQSGCEIFGTRVTPAGTLLDGSAAIGGVGISTGGAQLRDDFPSVTFNGTDYLVAWATLRSTLANAPGIRLARVATTGMVLPTPAGGFAISAAQPSMAVAQYALPVIAPTGRGACIAWLDPGLTGPQKQVEAEMSYAF